ncbi:glycosyltransferase family 2 protein [candidate division KSB1 bacterium]|nr:glycosyltransferase family 2 protein [candidate division KSB1 bacterium]
MLKLPLSVCVITLNETNNIEDCLTSVSQADEILVADTGSTDDTMDKARKFTSNLHQLEFKGHAQTKADLAELATHEWVLSLDADERVSPKLWQEIKTLINASDSEVNGMRLRRRSYFLGKPMRMWNNDFQLRLYRKEYGAWNDAKIHCGVTVQGEIVDSMGYLEHYTDPNLHHVLKKMNTYSTANAADMIQHKKKHISVFSAGVHTLSTFLRVYFAKGAILDGLIGFIFACMQAQFNWFRYVKAWEIRKGIAKLPETEDYKTK